MISVEMLLSRMEVQARSKPCSIAGPSAAAAAQLLLHTFEDKDIGVHRHSYREHEAGDSGERDRHRLLGEELEDHHDDVAV